MLNTLPIDVLKLILYNLSLTDIGVMTIICSLCNEAVDSIDWDSYFKQQTGGYDIDMIIDHNFMKNNGIYLMKVKDKDKINQWLRLYPQISTYTLPDLDEFYI